MPWITTNWVERIKDPSLDFKCYIEKTQFERVPFDIATDNVAKYLASLNKKIFVAFSGGYDSEFIVRKFHSLGIEFTPVIVHLENFSSEREYAYRTLRELKIKAVVLKISTAEYIRRYIKHIYSELNSSQAGAIWCFVHDYAISQNGILVVGEGIGGMRSGTIAAVEGINLAQYIKKEDLVRNYNTEDGTIITDGGINNNIIANQLYSLRDYNMFYHTFYPETFYMFYMLTPQIVISMLDAIEPTDLTWSDYKSRVFKLVWRPKFGTQYREFFIGEEANMYLKIRDYADNSRKIISKAIHYFGNKEELISLIVQ